MIFDRLQIAPCVIPVTPPADPRCKDSAFSLSNPSLCAGASLLLKPGIAMLCELENVQFRIFEYAQGVETELLTGVRFTTSNGEVFALGVNTGNGTALVSGAVTVTATHTDGRTAQAELTVLPGTRCCDDIRVLTSIVVDNSKSMQHAFSGYNSRLGFAKAIAASYGGALYQVDGVPKDADRVWTVNQLATASFVGFSNNVDEITDAIAAIGQTQTKTDLLPVLTTITDDLLAGTADRRILLLVGDGEHTINTDRQAIITAAATFKSLGGIIIAIGVRAAGQGYDLLERIATGGFFLNALGSNVDAVFSQLNYLKSILCAGFCVPPGDVWVNSPARDYSSFEHWSVIAGQANLVGEDLLNFLAVTGLYVELGTPATLQTIDAVDLVLGRSYRFSLDVAGNQRESITGQGIKIFVREAGVNDSDPNIFEQTIFPAWDSEFQTYSFTFNSTVNASVKLYVEQLSTGTPEIGNFIDKVKFEEVTSGIILLQDDFDTENLTYIPPRCGQSAGLEAIPNPETPSIGWIADGGEDLNIHAQFNYGITYLTNEGETAVTTVEYERTDTFGYSLTLRQLTIPQPDSDRVTGIRVWRSLGEEVLDPTATQLYLLAELPSGTAFYNDQEDEAAFTARYEPSIEAPTVNTTAIAAGALHYGYDYAGCCYELAVDYGAGENLVPEMTSNTEPSGTVSSGTAVTSEGDWWLAFDHDIGTTWFGTHSAGVVPDSEWIQFQYPTVKTVTAYRLTSHVIGTQTFPSAWILEGSTNGTDWTTLDEQTSVTGWVDDVSKLFYISAPGSFSYYRITFSATVGTVDTTFSVSEFELLAATTTVSTFTDNCPPCDVGTPGVQVAESPPLGNIETRDPPVISSFSSQKCAACPAGFVNLSANLIPAMTTNTSPSGTASASSNNSTAYRSFDRADTPVAALLDNTLPAYWQYQFGAAQTFAAYGIKSYKTSASPRDFALQGSTDGTTWTTLDSRTDIVWGSYQMQRWLVATPAAYTHYRLLITDFNSVIAGQQTTINLSQIELYTLPVNPCATGISPSSQAAADAVANLAATALLNCVPIYSATEIYIAHCEVGFGADVTKSETRQSLNSPDEAKADAYAAAKDAALDELDCEGSNNEQAIQIYDSTGGLSKASPYPSVKFVEGLAGVITDVTVEIHGLTHPSPDDIRIILVSPAGTAVELMRNCGGIPTEGASQVSGLELVFDDAAAASLPDGPTMVSGTFKPTQFGSAASLPSPCPPTPYDDKFDDFDGEDPNGPWSLFIVDDLTAFSGSISGGWELTITSA